MIIFYYVSLSHRSFALQMLDSKLALRLRNQRKRLIIAGLLIVVLHFLFLLSVAPRIFFDHTLHERTEVTQLSTNDLEKIKRQVLNNPKYALSKEELREEYKSREAPRNAQMLGAFNQVVPKETVVGATREAPREGGGGGSKTSSASQQSAAKSAKAEKSTKPQLKLSQLGLASKPLFAPSQNDPSQETETNRSQQSMAARQGPTGPHIPVGREDKNLTKGNENLLNAVESEFYSFFSRLEEPFIRNWYFLMRSHQAQILHELAMNKEKRSEIPVVVELTIDRDGNFAAVEVLQASGSRTYDQVTKQAIEKIGSLPNPPVALFEGKAYYSRKIGVMLYVEDASLLKARPDLYW